MKRTGLILLALLIGIHLSSAQDFKKPDKSVVAPVEAISGQSDSTHFFEPDSALVAMIDSLQRAHIDSLSRFFKDSSDIKKAKRKIRREMRDSIRLNEPRILSSFVLPDSLLYKRDIIWSSDSKFNEMNFIKRDTSYTYHYNDLPMMQKDVNATYLGTAGSAALYHNYFRREEIADAPMFSPYVGDSHTSDNVPQFNTKAPYTELAYWGTPFNSKTLEEANLNLLTTQNFTPSFNLTLAYRRYGAGGMLQNEKTSNQNTYIYFNYTGKRYFMNAGTIRQTINRTENGGVQDEKWIRDTTIDSKTIDVNLRNAKNMLKRRDYFIHQTLAIPLNFMRKDKDSLSIGEGTMAYLVHSAEFSTYNKLYTDEIAGNDRYGRDYYNNVFLLNEVYSNDEYDIKRFDNKFALKLQPFAPDAVVSKISAGIGYQYIGTRNTALKDQNEGYELTGKQHNVYIYGGASGQFRKYFRWEADADYYFAGYKVNDLNVNGKVTVSFYPRGLDMHLTGKVGTSLRSAQPYEQNYLGNHHFWENDFKKVSTTRFEALFSIPKWRLEAFAGYALIGNMLYYDNQAIIQQCPSPVNVLSAYLNGNFNLWKFHFDNQILFQKSSNSEVLPLPMLSLNLRWYFQFTVVKNAMDMQIGLNGLWHTKYYAPSYMADLGQFHTQNKVELGGVPYFDAFVNVQWKTACIFVKYSNVFHGWPANDYFSAPGYIRPDKIIKVGIFWPFHF